MNLSITSENVNLCCCTSTSTCMSTEYKDLPTHTSIPYSSKFFVVQKFREYIENHVNIDFRNKNFVIALRKPMLIVDCGPY